MISTFGIVLAVSYLLGVFLFWRGGRRDGFSSDDLFDLAILISLAGLGGGKFLPFLWGKEEFFWVGAVLGGSATIFIYSVGKHLPFFRLGDLASFAAGVSQALFFLAAGFLGWQFPLAAFGYIARAAILYLLRRMALFPGALVFTYLISEGILVYLFASAGRLWATAGAGLGIIGLAWIAIRSRFKVKRSNG